VVRLRRSARKTFTFSTPWALAVLVAIETALALAVFRLELDSLGFDFRGTLWEPGRAILAGSSPYPAPDAVADGNPSVYPPPILLAALPLALLPLSVATVIWAACLLVSVLAALWVS